ncbi:MAG: hypothetical protein H6753_05815 [Candidatus Omnitrophica bacterium]|nr:hypothetical protein [Candidatus Omnitrophota bacterium]
MKSTRDETIKRHFDLVAILAERLSQNNLNLIYHRYNYEVFGSWEIIVGTGHIERCFLWDGRDYYLIIKERVKVNSSQGGHGGKWEVKSEINIGKVEEGKLFEIVFQSSLEIKK